MVREVFTGRLTALGFASWLIPFVGSFAFFGPQGLMVPVPLFKSIMVVLFGGTGTWLLVRAFRTLRPTLANGLALGAYWLVINLVLDCVILLPLTGQPLLAYMQDIGLRYALIPIIAAGFGTVAERIG